VTKPNNVIDSNPPKPLGQTLKETPKKQQYHTVKESTLNFNKDDVFKKMKFNENPQQGQKVEADLLDFHQHNGTNQKAVITQTQPSQPKNFDFNFN
jgi:hypothetical protein